MRTSSLPSAQKSLVASITDCLDQLRSLIATDANTGEGADARLHFAHVDLNVALNRVCEVYGLKPTTPSALVGPACRDRRESMDDVALIGTSAPNDEHINGDEEEPAPQILSPV